MRFAPALTHITEITMEDVRTRLAVDAALSELKPGRSDPCTIIALS